MYWDFKVSKAFLGVETDFRAEPGGWSSQERSSTFPSYTRRLQPVLIQHETFEDGNLLYIAWFTCLRLLVHGSGHGWIRQSILGYSFSCKHLPVSTFCSPSFDGYQRIPAKRLRPMFLGLYPSHVCNVGSWTRAGSENC